MRFGCHLRSELQVNPLEFSIPPHLLASQIICQIWRCSLTFHQSPNRDHNAMPSPCYTRICVNKQRHPSYSFIKLCGHFVRNLSRVVARRGGPPVNMDFWNIASPAGSCFCPSLPGSPLPVRMIWEWAKLRQLVLLKPSGSHHHFYHKSF